MQYSARLVQATAATVRIQRVPSRLVEMFQRWLKQKHFFQEQKLKGVESNLLAGCQKSSSCIHIVAK